MEIAARLIAALSRPAPRADADRYSSHESYARSEYEQADYLLPLLRQFAPDHPTHALDLGSGQGGATERYAEALNADTMLGIDFDREKVIAARGLWRRSRFVVGSATQLPFRNDSFDLLLSHDGFEHFMAPQDVVEEASRTLRPGGRLIVSFCPYFTPKGPHLEHYVTLPYAHLVFARGTVARAAEIAGSRQIRDLPESGREAYRKRLSFGLWQARESINEMSIRRWERLLMATPGFELVAYRKFVDRRIYRPLLAVPLTQELVASVFAVLEKRPGAHIDRAGLARAQRNDLPHVIYHH